MKSFLTRMIGTAKLDSKIYEEVEADQSAFGQAAVIVILSGIAAVIGVTQHIRLAEMIAAAGLALLAWASWSAIAYVVGAFLCPEPQTRADWGELLRTTGFATAPGILSILGLIPILAGLAPVFAAVWTLFTFSLAVRQALDYQSAIRALGVSLVSWLLFAGAFFAFK
jgi:Yip1-like protein